MRPILFLFATLSLASFFPALLNAQDLPRDAQVAEPSEPATSAPSGASEDTDAPEPSEPEPGDTEIDVRDAVVKVHVSQRSPDFLRPWTKGRSQQSSGSGVIISGNRILTNAHVVLYANRVHVQGNQSSKRVLAKVVAVAPEVDLALLELNDDSFFADKPALEISDELPKLKNTINVYGFPIGGEQMSVTEGIVSRIECARIAYTGVGLRLQIDAALNPGNSGGPAVASGKIVGLAFSGIKTADNIGYVIAAEELTRFLNHINENGEYTGKRAMYDGTQTVENEALRDWLKLDDDQGGLVVTSPYEDDGPLKKMDVVTKLGDHELDRKGYVQITDDMKLNYQYVIPHLDNDGKVPATIIREGETMEIEIPVHTGRELLIPVLAGDYPSYFIHGPILFTTPSQEFLKQIRYAAISLANLESPLINRSVERPSEPGHQLVIVGPRLFTHASSEGYQGTGLGVVETIDGTEVKSLTHAAELLQTGSGDYVNIELKGCATRLLTFRRDEIADATEEILEDEGIRSQFSDDLEDVFDN